MNIIHDSSLRNSIQKSIASFQANRYLQSITKGLAAAMPVMIISSFAELLADMQLGDYQKWIVPIEAYLEILVNFTINIVAIYVVCGTVYSLAKSFDKNGLQAALIALLSFLIITPMGNFKLGKNMVRAVPVQ